MISEMWNKISDVARKAGKWGDYNCDLPPRILDSMLKFIKQNQNEFNTSFITWTGDNSDHSSGSISKEDRLK